MNAEKPKVLIIGPDGDSAIGIMQSLMIALGVDADICSSAEQAVDLAIGGKAHVLVYREAADLTGPETFEAIRWGYSTAGFIYMCQQGDPLRHRIIEDVRAVVMEAPFHLRHLRDAVAAVSPACNLAFEAAKAPA